MDQLCETGFFGPASKAFVKSSHGVSNFVQYKELGAILSAVATEPVDVRFVRDRDGIPKFLDAAIASSFGGQGLMVHTLERHEIESYLISKHLIQSALKALGTTVRLKDVEELVLEAADNTKSTARGVCRKSALLVNRHLESSSKTEAGELENKTDAWFDGLDTQDLETVIAVWPGKELLAEIARLANLKWSVQLTNGRLTAMMTKELVPQEIKTLFESLAGIGAHRAGAESVKSAPGAHSSGGLKKGEREDPKGHEPRQQKPAPRKPKAVPSEDAKAPPAVQGRASKTEAKAKPTGRGGQRGSKIASLTPNPNEAAVFTQLNRANEPWSLSELAAKAFPNVEPQTANSWVRNSLRRLVRAEWVEKVGDGTYRTNQKVPAPAKRRAGK